MDLVLSENKLQELAKKFEEDLKSLITPHNKTGKLGSSIKITFKKTSSGYEISIKALEYIKYLEGGKLLDNFLRDKTKELTKEITKTIAKDVLSLIKK